MNEDCSNQQVQSIDETWKELGKVTSTVLRNLQKMSDLIEILVNHSLHTECIPVPVPQKKVGHIQERVKYASDYKRCILQQMSLKLNSNLILNGAKVVCHICLMVCRNRTRFYTHLLQKHGCNFKFYCCMICKSQFDAFLKFKQHLCNFHDEIMIFQETEVILQIIDYGIRVIQKL